MAGSRSRGRSDVFPLNGGATTLGRSSVFTPGTGGGFMSGRPSGGAGGVGSIAEALASTITPVTGPVQDVGPPPVSLPFVSSSPIEAPSWPSAPPSYSAPQPSGTTSAVDTGFRPTFPTTPQPVFKPRSPSTSPVRVF